MASSALEDVLKREPPLPPYSTSPAFNFYRFLLETEYSSSRAVMKAQAGAALLPERHGIFASPVNVSAENLNLLEPVPPNWLDLGESYVRALIAEAGNLQGAELKTWFKNELRERLRFLSTAPKWVQSPCWPLRDGVPLVFLGQLSAGGLLHDDSQVYVFMHPASAEIVTLVQSA